MNKIFGLIGFPLGHSFSKGYFDKKFRGEGIKNRAYENFPLENIGQFNDLVDANPRFAGLNVTIPYKESVIPYLDETDREAAGIGAVNTIKFVRNSGKVKLIGYNTDIVGFRKSLLDFWDNQSNKALVLGSGGASKAVLHVLNTMDVEVVVVSRSKAGKGLINYNDLTPGLIKECKLIINTTPLGMYPQIEKKPEIPYSYISSDHFLFDLIYNPDETKFLKMGRMNGARTLNGLNMLVEQAEKSWEIWNS